LNIHIVGVRARRGVILVALAVVLSGCGIAHPGELNFRTDDRLEFIAPQARSLVSVPVTVRWTMHDFTVQAPRTAPPSRNAGYFAVFVDRAPIKPGQTMRAIAKNDQLCLHQPRCPDETYLAERRIFTTTAGEITLTQIPAIAGNTEKVQLHAITVVPMDTSGHRIGESSWQLDVRMRKLGL
jgi:hypothetical protein